MIRLHLYLTFLLMWSLIYMLTSHKILPLIPETGGSVSNATLGPQAAVHSGPGQGWGWGLLLLPLVQPCLWFPGDRRCVLQVWGMNDHPRVPPYTLTQSH